MEQTVRDLLEKAKELACAAGKAAGNAADAASKKAGEAFETTKLALSNFDLNTDIEMLYKEIGKNVYLTHKGEEVDPEKISETLAKIDEKFEKIEANKKQMAFIKTVAVCPACGAECDKKDAFCRVCGQKL